METLNRIIVQYLWSLRNPISNKFSVVQNFSDFCEIFPYNCFEQWLSWALNTDKAKTTSLNKVNCKNFVPYKIYFQYRQNLQVNAFNIK